MQHTFKTTTDPNKSEILNPVKSTLLSFYPEKDGWKLYNRYNWASKVFDYVLQKEDNNQIDRILIEINFENHINNDVFSKLDVLAKRLCTSTSNIIRKIMIIDDLASTDKVPSDIDIIPISKMLKDGLLCLSPAKSKLVA